jgi:GT2 family glycosyltransferase
LAAARNAAANAARADSLLFLDVDCIPMPRLVGTIRRRITETGALICAEVRYLNGGPLPYDWCAEAMWRMAHSHPVRCFPIQGLRRELNYGLFWSLAFALARSTYFAVGGFDEGFTGYGAEDTDFGFRAEAAGIPMMFLGGVGAIHQHHDVFDPPLQHFDDIVQNAQRFHSRWRSWPMRGWLDAFAERGLIHFNHDEVTIIRRPTPAEVDAARVQRPF